MDAKQWQKLADAYQGGCRRLTRASIVGHVVSAIFLAVGTQIPAFPFEQLYVLQFTLVCISIGISMMAACTNYMFVFFAIKQIGESNGDKR